MGQGRHRESRELCKEAIGIAQQLGALAQEGDARRALGVDLAFLGDLEAGVRELTEARRIADAVGRVDEVARCYATLSGLLEAFGRLEAAAQVALEGAELAASQGLGRWHSPFLTATAGRARFAQGRWDEADVLLRRAAERVAPELAAVESPSARPAASWIAAGVVPSRPRGCSSRRLVRSICIPSNSPGSQRHCSSRRQSWPCWKAGWLMPRLPWPKGCRLPAGSLAFAAPLYVLGIRAAADRAELARAHRNADEVLQLCRLGDTLGVELRTQVLPERADGRPRAPHQGVCGGRRG